MLLKQDDIKAAEYTPEKVNFEGQWYKCPYCKKALFLLHKGAIVRGVSYRCKACKHDIEVNI